MDQETREFLRETVTRTMSYGSAIQRYRRSKESLLDLEIMEAKKDLFRLITRRDIHGLGNKLDGLVDAARAESDQAFEELQRAERAMEELKLMIDGKSLPEIDLHFTEKDQETEKIWRKIQEEFDSL